MLMLLLFWIGMSSVLSGALWLLLQYYNEKDASHWKSDNLKNNSFNNFLTHFIVIAWISLQLLDFGRFFPTSFLFLSFSFFFGMTCLWV